MGLFVKGMLFSGYFSVGVMTSAKIGYMCGASLGENNPNENKFIHRAYWAGVLWPAFIAWVVLSPDNED